MDKPVDKDTLEEVKARLAERVDEFVEYAHPIFAVKEWEYYDGKPDKKRLRSVCHQVIESLMTGRHSEASTGRVRAWYQYHEEAGIIQFGLDIHRATDKGSVINR